MKLLLPPIRLIVDLPFFDFSSSGKEGAAQNAPGGICLRVDANISCAGVASQNSSSRQPWHKGTNLVGTVKPGTGRLPDPLIPQELQLVPSMQVFVALRGTVLLFTENAQILPVFPHFPPIKYKRSSTQAQLLVPVQSQGGEGRMEKY